MFQNDKKREGVEQMPPKPKFTREEIVAAALDFVADKGMDALTARDLGNKLGSSARPIFTVFANMEEVQEEVRKAALRYFENYMAKANQEAPVFKQIGMQMILFALEKPNLFRLVYMADNAGADKFEDVFRCLGTTAKKCIEYIIGDYQMSEPQARALFEHVWIHTYGISVLCATGMCRFSKEQISEMLTQDFRAMMMLMKSEKNNDDSIGR